MHLTTFLVLLAGLGTHSYTEASATPPTPSAGATLDDKTLKDYDIAFVVGVESRFKPETADRTESNWGRIGVEKGIKKGEKYCLEKHPDKCFVPTRVLYASGPWSILSNNAAGQPYAVVRPLTMDYSAKEGINSVSPGILGMHPISSS